MENYIENYLSLPEQVQKNKCDISQLKNGKWFRSVTTITPKMWEILGNNRYQADIKNVNFKDDMVYFVVGNDEKSAFYAGDINFTSSYDGGILIVTNRKFDFDITLQIYYNYNIDN